MQPFDQSPSGAPKNTAPLTFRLEQTDLETSNLDLVKKMTEGNLVAKVMASTASCWILGLVPLVLAFAITILLDSKLLQNFWFFASIVLLSALAIVLARQAFLYKHFLPLTDGPTLGHRSIEIEDDGLIITQDGIQSAYMWQSILEVYETPDNIYLFFDTCFAHMFPKNAFPSSVQVQEFAAYARERVNLAHQSNKL